MTAIAWSKIRDQPFYRRDAFESGLRAAGYDVRRGEPGWVNRGDVLLLWNRYGANHDLACWFEKSGGTVVVAENGFVGLGGQSPHSMAVRDPYAINLGYHNDSATRPLIDGDRWSALGVQLQPWREGGGHVLICPNRSFGTPGRIMPPQWPEQMRAKFEAQGYQTRIRPHPGNHVPARPLERDLEGCWFVVIWNSSAGIHALIAGVPVISCAPNWICRAASWDDRRPLPPPARLPALQRMAQGQFFVAEIAAGIPFQRLQEKA